MLFVCVCVCSVCHVSVLPLYHPLACCDWMRKYMAAVFLFSWVCVLMRAVWLYMYEFMNEGVMECMHNVII